LIRRCDAPLGGNKRCRKPALTGRLRCRLHGGRSGRPPGIPLRTHENTALQAGRARWVERMRLLKARGLVAKFPVGRKPGSAGRTRSKDKTIARAQRVLKTVAMAINRTRGLAPFVEPGAAPGSLPARPLSKADKHSLATDLALDIVQQILELGVDPSDPKILAQVKDTALTVIGQAIRLSENELRRVDPVIGSYDEMFERLGLPEKPLEAIFAEVEAEEADRE
jgi:hypothetical protein